MKIFRVQPSGRLSATNLIDKGYVFGTDPKQENAVEVPKDRRSFRLSGVAADAEYSFRVQAVRKVDADVNPSGQITSAPVQAASGSYQPARTPNITGNIAGVPAQLIGEGIALVKNVVSDNVLSRNEKPGVKREWVRIQQEYTSLDSQANTFGFSTTADGPRKTFRAAYTKLSNYLASLTGWEDVTTDTNIVGVTFKSNWDAYYNSVAPLQTALDAHAASVANWSGVSNNDGKKPDDNATKGAIASNLIVQPGANYNLDPTYADEAYWVGTGSVSGGVSKTFTTDATICTALNTNKAVRFASNGTSNGASITYAVVETVLRPARGGVTYSVEVPWRRFGLISGIGQVYGQFACLKRDGTYAYVQFQIHPATSSTDTAIGVAAGRITIPDDTVQARFQLVVSVNASASPIIDFQIGQVRIVEATRVGIDLLLGDGTASSDALLRNDLQVKYSDTEPSNPTNGDIWVDTSILPNVTKVRISGAWQIAATDGADVASNLRNSGNLLNSEDVLNDSLVGEIHDNGLTGNARRRKFRLKKGTTNLNNTDVLLPEELHNVAISVNNGRLSGIGSGDLTYVDNALAITNAQGSQALFFNQNFAIVAPNTSPVRPAGLRATADSVGTLADTRLGYVGGTLGGALAIGVSAGNTRCVTPMWRINQRAKYRVRGQVKASAATSSGFYARFNELDSEPATTVTHLTHAATSDTTTTIAYTRERVGSSAALSGGIAVENAGLTTSYQSFDIQITPSSTAKYMNLQLLRWTGMGSAELQISSLVIEELMPTSVTEFDQPAENLLNEHLSVITEPTGTGTAQRQKVKLRRSRVGGTTNDFGEVTLPDNLHNLAIGVSGGQIQGIGTGNQTYVDNASAVVDYFDNGGQVAVRYLPYSGATGAQIQQVGLPVAVGASADITLEGASFAITGNRAVKVGSTSWEVATAKQPMIGTAIAQWRWTALADGADHQAGLSKSRANPSQTWHVSDWAVAVHTFQSYYEVIFDDAVGIATSVTKNLNHLMTVTYDGLKYRAYADNTLLAEKTGAATNQNLFFKVRTIANNFGVSDVTTGAYTINDWQAIGGTGRPENNATLGATVGSNIFPSGGGGALASDRLMNDFLGVSFDNSGGSVRVKLNRGASLTESTTTLPVQVDATKGATLGSNLFNASNQAYSVEAIETSQGVSFRSAQDYSLMAQGYSAGSEVEQGLLCYVYDALAYWNTIGIHPTNATQMRAAFDTANGIRLFSVNPVGNVDGFPGVTLPNGADYFHSEFVGYFEVTTAGVHNFGVDGDDAVELLIDGKIISTYYGAHGMAGSPQGTASVDLKVGRHLFVFRHTEGAGGEGARAYYRTPEMISAAAAYAVIPATRFSRNKPTVNTRIRFSDGNLLADTGTYGIKNADIKIAANGALSGGGGGNVTISGLGYVGALDATKGATIGSDFRAADGTVFGEGMYRNDQQRLVFDTNGAGGRARVLLHRDAGATFVSGDALPASAQNLDITISGVSLNGIGSGSGTAVANSGVMIAANGALSGGGGGQVTAPGLGVAAGATRDTRLVTNSGNIIVVGNGATIANSDGVMNEFIRPQHFLHSQGYASVRVPHGLHAHFFFSTAADSTDPHPSAAVNGFGSNARGFGWHNGNWFIFDGANFVDQGSHSGGLDDEWVITFDGNYIRTYVNNNHLSTSAFIANSNINIWPKLFVNSNHEIREFRWVPFTNNDAQHQRYGDGVLVEDRKPAEPASDVTSQITGIATIIIKCDSGGTPLSGQLTRNEAYKLLRNGVDVTTSATWSSPAVTGITHSISNGVLSISAVSGSEVKVRMQAVRNGITRHADVTVKKELAPASTSTTSSSTGASGPATGAVTSPGYNSATWVVISDVLKVTTGTTDAVALKAGDVSHDPDATTPIGDWTVEQQWQRSYDGTNWTNIGAVASGASNVTYESELGTYFAFGPALTTNITDAPGASKADIRYRLVGRVAVGTTKTHWTSGASVSATPG